MAITVHLSGHLKSFTGGEVELNLPGEFATVGETLSALWKRHPALRDRILDEQGVIRTHVNVFLGSSDVKRRQGLNTRIDAAELHIFNAVSGG